MSEQVKNTGIKTRPDDSLIHIAVLVGQNSQVESIYVYWNTLLSQFEKWSVTYQVIFWNDFEETLPDWKQFDVMIVAVDSVSGGTEFGGDKGLKYFQDQASGRSQEIRRFVDNGGVLFCELQGGGGKPAQLGYDAIFGKNRKSVINNSEITRFNVIEKKAGYENLWNNRMGIRGYIAKTDKKYHGHPLLYGLHPYVLSDPKYGGEEVIPGSYRRDKQSQWSLFYRCHETLYTGWFTHWETGWLPLLRESETNVWPVLLSKIQGKGLLIASTLHITSDWHIPLIRNIISYKLYKKLWINFHEKSIRAHRWGNILMMSIFIIVGSIAFVLSGRYYPNLVKSINDILTYGVGGLSLLFIISIAYKFYRRPLGMPLFIFLRQLLHWRNWLP